MRLVSMAQQRSIVFSPHCLPRIDTERGFPSGMVEDGGSGKCDAQMHSRSVPYRQRQVPKVVLVEALDLTLIIGFLGNIALDTVLTQ